MERSELLIGVSAGIAAYKAADLVSQCVQAGAGVTVVLSPAAKRFVGPTTFEALAGRPVYTSLFRAGTHHRGAHIGLAEQASVYCIAPATADVLAKLAHGHADDLLSTLALSFTGPLLVAPAMNCEMWQKGAVQRNVAQLRSDGAVIIEPDEGWLSCGKVGAGRMADPARIVEAIRQALAKR
jgi:phosphopantothenoylcysteine decarboxylase/phosphopantothenate--cysteine ligase